ncbi:MAG TPA: hypothetical protein VJ650_01490 [Gemmatimonadaceae bacterium]|nr:hypothetical protein [Gemmatimonadaceae bacterium]
MRRHLYLSALVLPLALAACLDPDPVPESNYGVIGLTTVPTATDTILSPEALFYRTGLLGLPSSIVTSDQCQLATYPTPSQGTQLPRFLDAGDSVAISTATTTKHLFPTTSSNGEAYVLDEGERFPFHPGESVTITVPGAPGGFANGTISILTARGFTLGPISASPPADSALRLTWTPAGDDSTKMLISLQYGLGQIAANRQIFCSLVDDGVATVPSILLGEWRTATTGSRKAEAARWRVALKEVTGGVLLVVSAFEVEQFID